MKYWYAKNGGRCYKFPNKSARTIAIKDSGFTALTAVEAMRQFGYTDSTSTRVIKAYNYVVLPERKPAAYLRGENSIAALTKAETTVSIGDLAYYALSPDIVPEEDYEAVRRFIHMVYSRRLNMADVIGSAR